MSQFKILAIATLAFSSMTVPAMASEIEPIDLAFQAYQGYFIEEGIPSAGTFIQKVQLGQIDAKTLVKSAIEQKRLSPTAINDRDYLQKIDAALFKIERRR